MKKYEQLESQIQELQAEVERLKQEEAPRDFKISDLEYAYTRICSDLRRL